MEKAKDFKEKPVDCFELFEDTEIFSKFIDFIFKKTDSFCLSCYGNGYCTNRISFKDFLNSRFGKFKYKIFDHEYTKNTFVTNGGREALVIFFENCDETKKFLLELKHIYNYLETPIIDTTDWVSKNKRHTIAYLEDLCFLDKGTLKFCSCTHEEFCYMDRKLLEEFKKIL